MSSREEVLALVAVRERPTSPADESVDAWVARLALAGSRMHPWIAHRLSVTGALDRLPDPAASLLRSAARSSAITDLRRRAHFADIVDSLERAGVPFVVLKGMALAYTVYPSPALRPMSDIDLWVEPPHRELALATLGRLAWHIPPRYAVHAPSADDTVLLEHRTAGLVIEVHTRPLSITAEPAGATVVWARCVWADIAGRRVRICQLTDQLTHLAIHLVRKHGFSDGLLGLLDIALLAERVPDAGAWEGMAAAHRAEGAARWTAMAFVFARDLLGAPIPAAYFEAAGEPVPTPELRRAATAQIWDREPKSTQGVDWLLARGGRRWASSLFTYIRFFYAAPGADGRPWWRALGQRLRYDLTYRAGRYLRALRGGEFRRDRLAHRARMLRDREALIASIGQARP